MNFIKILGITCLAMFAITGVSAQNTKRNQHNNIHKDLIAKQTNVKDQIKLIDDDTFIDFGFENIEPEPDIYTEGWNSKSVNPFSGVEVPQTAMIDVSNFAMPHYGKMTSPYGWRKRFGRMHKGVDINIKSNDTIYAAFDGKVRLTNYEARGYGNYIILRHPNDLETVYGHLNKFLVKRDQYVKAGDPIALGGNTGRSTGPHLHFETRYMGYAINPSAIFDFANHTTHTDIYAFDKNTYQNARNYAPTKSETSVANKNTYKQANKERKTYKVKKGETLSKIAKKNGISVTTLCRLNGISKNQKIRVGQSLRVK